MRSFKLFSSCFIVKGFRRSCVYDLQREKYHLIPNALYEILLKFNGSTISKVKKNYADEHSEIIDDYFSFLEMNELIFYTNTPNLFPEIDIEFLSSSKITNAIIDLNLQSNYNIKKIINELDSLGCKAIQFRFFDSLDINKINKILLHTQLSKCNSIEIILKFSKFYTKKTIMEILNNNMRVSSIIFHSTNFEKIIFLDHFKKIPIIYIKNNLKTIDCGKIDQNYFTVNHTMFFESQKFNSCLNKKISIDVDGNIKNCPNICGNFGHSDNTSFENVINQNEFNKYWVINKDCILICSYCEFRYMCSDCRAFIQDSNNIYSKPKKCSYNPFTSTWEK